MFPGMPPILYQCGNLSVAQTRNRIVRYFHATDCDVLVMVDDDVVPSPHWLERILPFMGEYGMVGLPHPFPDPQNRAEIRLGVFDWAPGGWTYTTDLEDGLNECDALATGCVAISRQALDALGSDPFHIGDAPFSESDDYYFCKDLGNAGFKVGYWWDGWFADHMSTVSLAPLWESRKSDVARMEEIR